MDEKRTTVHAVRGKSDEQESVWEYPRPPRLEATGRYLRVVHGGLVIAETRHAKRILETSHPPVYYFPPEDVSMSVLRPSAGRGSFCEFKGIASYWDLDLTAARDEGRKELAGPVLKVAWSYADPSAAFQGLKDHLAFYASRIDECWVDGEQVLAQREISMADGSRRT